MASQSSGRRPLVAGNWKMHLTHLEAIALVQKVAFSLKPAEFEAVETAMLPPFTSIRSVQTLIDGDNIGLVYGAQDLSAQASGAYTGEISGGMLAALGCTYVTVGHSERREYHFETDGVVQSKVAAAYAAGLTPILCLGEGLAIRQAGGHVEHCVAQLKAAASGLDKKQARSLVVAYEPVWAIGTGEVATPEDAQEVCAALRTTLAELYTGGIADGIRILYGGSVKPGSAAEIFAQQDVDGGLIGGASLVAEDFSAIVRAAMPVAA